MPLATAAMCGCHASHHVAKVRSSVQQTHDEELCRHENKRGFPLHVCDVLYPLKE